MAGAEARVQTDRAERYFAQLCSHLGSMQHMRHVPASPSIHGGEGMPRVQSVEQTGNHAVVRFADGSWELTAAGGALFLHVEAEEDAALERLKGAIAARMAKIGRRDGLRVDWLPDNEVQDRQALWPTTGAEPAGARGGRARWRRLGWFALAALAVAVHLGLIGSLFGGGGSEDVAADVIIALIASKLILIAVHYRFGRGRPHHRRPSSDTPGRAEIESEA